MTLCTNSGNLIYLYLKFYCVILKNHEKHVPPMQSLMIITAIITQFLQVTERDKGCYMCQINTSPSMTENVGCVDVQGKVPVQNRASNLATQL